MKERVNCDNESIVEGLRQVVQDLLVPEIKALQVRIEHLEAELKEHRKKNHEQFVKFWQVLSQLVEAQHHVQVVLQRILELLDITKELREAQARQKVIEERAKWLYEQIQRLRGLMELSLHQRGIKPPSTLWKPFPPSDGREEH